MKENSYKEQNKVKNDENPIKKPNTPMRGIPNQESPNSSNDEKPDNNVEDSKENSETPASQESPSSLENNGSDENNSEAEATIKMPKSVKKLLIAAIAGIISLIMQIIIFLIVLFLPVLLVLGIVGSIFGNDSGISSSPFNGGIYTQVNSSYWWPVATAEDGLDYDDGEPVTVSISSEFGSRTDPITGAENDNHQGIDISVAGYGNGEVNIIAARDGTVIYPTSSSPLNCSSDGSDTSCGGGYGNYVKIQHDDGSITLYGHLYANTITVKEGDTVKQGQVIGKMGSSGSSTGTHLHFGIEVNGAFVDPLNYISPSDTRPNVHNSGLYVSGDSNKQSVCLTLQNSGLSQNGIAAIMTNMSHESGFEPTALGDNGTSYGLCQWHNERYDDLKNTCQNDYSTIACQIEYLLHDLESYSGLYNDLKEGSLSAEELTYNFCFSFEVPADTEKTCNSRTNETKTYSSYVYSGCQ